MSFACLWSPAWQTGVGPAPELVPILLQSAPRIAVRTPGPQPGVVWADARGLSAVILAEALLDRAAQEGVTGARAGVAGTPSAAEIAARRGPDPVTFVPPGAEHEFLAPYPLNLLESDPHLLGMLEGVGVFRCGHLATLSREAVEVRFGPAAVALWRRSRADEVRHIFAPTPREQPHASLEWVDYVLTDPERLVFTANALLGSVCAALQERGEGTRYITLSFVLANGHTERCPLRTARPTAMREIWLRRIRTLLEGLSLPDAVAGVSLQIEKAETVTGRQADLFDPGIAGADAAEAALVRLLDDHGDVVVTPSNSVHPLLERRTRWTTQEPDAAVAATTTDPWLTLQLLPEPMPVTVQTRPLRDHLAPVRYREGQKWLDLLSVSGPDRRSGSQWEDQPYAREYFRGITHTGVLVWLFRDARTDRWYLHGWWD